MKSIFKQTEFELKNEELAQLTAFITDSIIYLDSVKNKYVLIPKENLSNVVKEAYNKGDFFTADMVLKSAKDSLQKDISKELNEVTSKSTRVDGNQYIRIALESFKRNISLGDILKESAISQIEVMLNDLESLKNANKTKIKTIRTALEYWKNKRPTKPQMRVDKQPTTLSDKGLPSLEEVLRYDYPKDFYCDVSNEVTTKYFRHFAKMRLKEKFRDWNLSDEFFDKFSSHIIYFSDSLEVLGLYIDKGTLNLSISLPGSFDEDNITCLQKELSLIDSKYEEKFKKVFKYDPLDTDAIYDIIDPLLEIELKLSTKDSVIMIDSIKLLPKNREQIKKYLLGKYILNELSSLNANEIEKNNDQLKKKAELAIKSGDFETAQKYNRMLLEYGSVDFVANWIVDLLLSALECSEVITFTIPKVLSYLLEAVDKDELLSAVNYGK